ncbi:MAG: hypothetical protein QOJ29_2148 [Thermoleophilaceae bacterium]|jgi:phosphoglycolate phosphatase-like HAD superfamily hydrolase|nr:hypothetical protein [Thermoleophilaceae bacterium]
MTADRVGAPQVLVLDFDGVLCDSVDECLQIAWFAHTGAPARAFAEQGIAAVPPVVAARFRRARPFMRQLAHFLVPLLDAPATRDAAAFDAYFARLPQEQTAAFAAAATAYRSAVRRAYSERWLTAHRVHARIAAMAHDTYIATARDDASVTAILGAHDVQVTPARVFGSLHEKTAALASIAALESARAQDVWLIDDSVQNCLAAHAAGFGACWASWGYRVPGDPAIACSAGIPAVTPDDLVGLLSHVGHAGRGRRDD